MLHCTDSPATKNGGTAGVRGEETPSASEDRSKTLVARPPVGPSVRLF